LTTAKANKQWLSIPSLLQSYPIKQWFQNVLYSTSNEEKVDVLIMKACRLTVRETVVQLRIGHSAMQKMINILRYQKMCCHWVPLLLTDEILLNVETDTGS
jgi:hypothetical protein